jgi:hypothetical protein
MADLPITSDQGAQPIVVNDPTTTANVANVKAASTAAVASDNSLVVALSPNSPLPTGTNNIGVTGVAQGSTTSGEHGDLVQGAVTTAAPSYSTGQTSPLSLTTVGNLRVDGSSVTQPVSGTTTDGSTTETNFLVVGGETNDATAQYQPIPEGAGGRSVIVEGVSGGTAVTVSGTVTANQGTPNTAANKWPIEIVDSGGVNVATVNSSNELLVTDTDLTLAQGSTTSGQLGPLVQGAVTTAAPTYTTGQTDPLSLTTTGSLRVNNNDSLLSQGSTTSGELGSLVMGAVTTSAPSYTTAQTSPLSLDTSGGLRTNENLTQIAGNAIATAASGIAKVGITDSSGTSITLGQKAMASSVPVVIASDQVSAIPQVEYISRFTKNNQSYTTSTTVSMATSGTDNPLILIRNPSGSGKVFYLWGVRCGISVANVFGTFRLFINPTVTVNGVSQTPVSLNGGGGAGASSMLVTTLPTVTVSGSQIETGVVGENADSVQIGDGFIIAIQANNSVLLTGSPSSNARNAELTIQWVEL